MWQKKQDKSKIWTNKRDLEHTDDRPKPEQIWKKYSYLIQKIKRGQVPGLFRCLGLPLPLGHPAFSAQSFRVESLDFYWWMTAWPIEASLASLKNVWKLWIKNRQIYSDLKRYSAIQKAPHKSRIKSRLCHFQEYCSEQQRAEKKKKERKIKRTGQGLIEKNKNTIAKQKNWWMTAQFGHAIEASLASLNFFLKMVNQKTKDL